MEKGEIRYSPLPTQRAFIESDAVVNVIYSNTGEGKSQAAETPILFYDGSIKRADEVKVGDLLMGDDSTPRKVLSLGRGRDQMYKIIPVKGDSVTVNGPHILVLKRTNTTLNPEKNGEIVHISVDGYLKTGPTFKHLHKLYRVPAEFPEKPTPVDPYFLGLWLADGTHINTQITTQDQEIIDYLYEYATKKGMNVTVSKHQHSKACGYSLVRDKHGNGIMTFLRDYNLLGNKHIPLDYKANSRENRLRLLAGLVDGDGWLNHEGWQLIFKNETLANDVAFVARSLGLAAYIKPRQKTGFGITGTYFHVMISGDCACVPIRVEHKKCQPRKQVKNPLMTGIKEIQSLGEGDYYGFTLDGNHHYLWGDFTVTHNTFACIGAILRHARRCGRPIRCAIVRDTLENLKNSVVVSIKEFFQDYPWAYRFTDQDKKLRISAQDEEGKRLDITADLFGIDDLGSLSRLQGPEYALIWLNEPAPMAERVNAGLAEEVFNAALVRCARQKGTKARLQVDMNPADEEHWTFKRFLEDEAIDPENPLITKAVFRVPYGENVHVNEVSRQAVRAAYKNDPASYARYVEGQFAVIYRGEKVTPYYKRLIHLLPHAAEPVKGLESVRLWDSWGAPCCILGQITTIGRLIIYDVCLIDGNSDLRVLINTQVEPLLNSPRWKGKARNWRDIGDFTMGQRDQSNVEESAKLVIQRAFGGRFEAGPSTWKLIKQGLDDMFGKHGLIQGMPSVQLDPVGAKLLDRALNGAWHYPVDNQGKRSREKPVKDSASHAGDAFANGCAVLRPSSRKADIKKMREMTLKTLKRAQSYAVAGGTM